MPLTPGLAPEILAFLATAQAAAGPALPEQSPAQARTDSAARFVAFWGAREAIASVGNAVARAPGGDVPIRIYRPASGVLPVVVFAHGGGWVIGDLDTHDGFCRALAYDAQAVVVAVGYRLAPEAPFPAAIDDVAAALGWVCSHADELEVDPARISMMGDSAGGNLTAAAVQQVSAAGRSIASQVLIYPVTDTRTDTPSYESYADGHFLTRAEMHWFIDHYLPSPADLEDPRAAPLRGAVTHTVPSYVAVAQIDPLRDEGVAYAEKLAAAGVAVQLEEWPGMIHGFLNMRTVTPAADRLRQHVVDFLHATWRD